MFQKPQTLFSCWFDALEILVELFAEEQINDKNEY